MFRSLKSILLILVLAAAGTPHQAAAFALMGPYTSWEVAAIGYNPYGGDMGGPMNLGEEYRWNLKVITYGFDPSFASYFGKRGMEEVNKAMAILNDLRPMSRLSKDLSEFPTDTRRVNYEAQALGLLDLKSYTLSMMLEEMGLASPERYVWTLRDKHDLNNGNFQYLVVQRNFDPVTLEPSAYVNGVLYTYAVRDPIPITTSSSYADAQEMPLDPQNPGFTAVVSLVDGLYGPDVSGEFMVGLTRDDVGGLRYLYAGHGPYANLNVETLPAGVGTNAVTSSGGSPWSPVTGGTNSVVNVAVRPGVDKVIFRQVSFDSTFGQFVPVTNSYVDTYMTNYHIAHQRIERGIDRPDILFAAADIGLYVNGIPVPLARTTTAGWQNNSGLNGSVVTEGPGQITPQVVITFNKLTSHYLVNSTPNFLQESAGMGPAWGSFDGTTNEPAVYPVGTSVQDLVEQVLANQ